MHKNMIHKTKYKVGIQTALIRIRGEKFLTELNLPVDNRKPLDLMRYFQSGDYFLK